MPLSRRRLLGGTLSIGALGAVTGVGTRALFSDQAQFQENELASGRLDLGLAWQETYNGRQVGGGGDCGSSDPEDYVDSSGAVITLDAVEPGDEGTIGCCTRVQGEADVWFRIVPGPTPENGLSQAEQRYGDDTPDEGELQDELTVSVTTWSGGDCDPNGEETVATGTFASVLDGPVRTGIHLDGDGDPLRCLGVHWSLPTDASPVVLSDAVQFGLEFAAVQSRYDTPVNPWNNT
jgi:predicted ribosomally synthesized peptide with SipW-like signal peptide